MDKRVYLLAEMADNDKDISDPYGGDSFYYAQTAAQIGEYLRLGWTKMKDLAVPGG
jgi:protein-tyrosine-phosphatase